MAAKAIAARQPVIEEIKVGDDVVVDGERGTVRGIEPYFWSFLEFYIEFTDKYESVLSDEVTHWFPVVNSTAGR